MNKNIPLSIPNLSIEIADNLREAIETNWISNGGRFIKEFEEKVARYVGVDRVVSCQSGTAGLHLAMRALDIQVGDGVIAPTVTFIAAVNPIAYVGAEPIFMDCDENLNLDVQKLRLFLEEECYQQAGKTYHKISGLHIKAIVVVHVFGNPANLDEISRIAKEYNLWLVEDSTEALGSYYREGEFKGKYCGTIGDIGVYSFNANKIITTGGGGMIVSRHSDLLDKMEYLSVQAKTDPLYFIHDEIGYNYRMLNINAAIGTSQIDMLEDFIQVKIRNYMMYAESIKKISGLRMLPFREDTRPNYWFYSVMIDEAQYGMNRDLLLMELDRYNIQTRPLWGLVHEQKPYKNNIAYKIEKAYEYAANLLNIPCSSNLTEEDVKTVIRVLEQVQDQ